jgi:hypothetical protein
MTSTNITNTGNFIDRLLAAIRTGGRSPGSTATTPTSTRPCRTGGLPSTG